MKIDRVSYTYPRKGTPTIHDIQLEISEGITGLFGPNGSGKTTLLKCLAGIIRDISGTIIMNGIEMNKLNIIERAKEIAYVPQESELNMPFTAFDVIAMGRNPHQKGMYPSQDDLNHTNMVMRMFGIESIKNEYFTELSGGQKQLVSIARAVNQGSRYIILDEPVSNLDYSNAHKIWTTLDELKKRGKIIIISSHDPNHIMRYCDNVVLMQEGSIGGKGTPEELITEKNLEKLFGIPVEFGTIGTVRMVSPRDL